MSYQDDLILLVQRAIALAKTVLASQKNIAVAPVTLPPTPAFQPNLDDAQHHDPPLRVPSTFPEALLWDTPPHAFHSLRVKCDRAGTGWILKDTITACVYQESNFYNRNLSGSPIKNENKNKAGIVTSIDWGMFQINDFYHIGPGKDFPSVAYVIDNPDKMADFMIACAMRGQLKLWSSYQWTDGNGVVHHPYKQWLPLTSPMWKLAQKV